MAFLPKKKPRKPRVPEEKLRVRVIHRPPKVPAEFPPPGKEAPQAQPPVEKIPILKHRERPLAKALEVIGETKKGVWKVLPLIQKIIIVVVVILVVSGVIYHIVIPLLTPARDLTGTWRSSLSGQGLVTWAEWAEASPTDFGYWDVELELTQTGNTIAGTLTRTLRKATPESGAYDWGVMYSMMNQPYSAPITGTVEGTKIEFSVPDYDLWKGTFTTDLMSGTWESLVTTDFPLHKGNFSLNRVW